MKFGKEFTSQMVPEWQEAYMNYNYLKTLLKEIQDFRAKNSPVVPDDALRRRPTLYRAFSGLIHRQHSAARRHHPPTDQSDVESQTILVTTAGANSGAGAGAGAGGRYMTTFMKTAEEGGEYELVYFRRLDEEFNKVEGFYRKKVDEVMNEASLLNKQMEALIAFRIKVHQPSESGHWLAADHAADVEMTRLATDVAASTASLAATAPHSARISGRRVTFMDAIDEGSNNSSNSDESRGKNNNNNNNNSHGGVVKEERRSPKPEKLAARAGRPAPLEVLNKVTMNNPVETPRSTIKGFLNVPLQTELTFNRDNLKKVESQLKRAFVEFYQKLRLLKSFAFLNTMAFSKIMKKYDKITSRDASRSYMNMVDNSILGTSDEVNKLMERVEATFIKHFSNANRSKGMSVLRPKPKRERHRVTFSTGFFAGCTAALALALILIVRARNLLEDPGKAKYMDTMFPLYSLFGFIVLHILMYAGNVYFWRRYRVNYSFIFGFKAGTELGYRQVLFLGFVLSTLALGAVLSNLDMQLDPKTKDYKALTELLPLILLLGMAVTLLCPFNVFFRSSRQFFLVCMFHGLAAPLYKVTLPDFFLADQMTSQVQALRSVQFYICYYGWGDYKHRDNTCPSLSVYKTFLFLVAVVPYVSRLMQCLRRLFEEKDPMQGYNGLKYFLTIIAVSMRTADSIDGGVSWKIMAWLFSVSAALVSMYWDVVIDWGLLQRRSRNRWLRDKLMVPFPSVYFAAIVLNTLLRFAWLQTVLNIQLFSLHKQTMVALVASLEIIRRGVWNFFRLENEHLNNVGKYRAFKSVPLPFNYEEEDEDKDE